MRRIHALNTYMKRLLELYLLEIQRFEKRSVDEKKFCLPTTGLPLASSMGGGKRFVSVAGKVLYCSMAHKSKCWLNQRPLFFEAQLQTDRAEFKI